MAANVSILRSRQPRTLRAALRSPRAGVRARRRRAAGARRRRRSARARRSRRRCRRRAVHLAPEDRADEWVDGRAQLSGRERRQPVGRQTTAAPRSTSAAASFASPATPTCTCRGSTTAQFALFVAQGRVIVRVRVLEPGEIARIDTPNTQIALTRPGLYRDRRVARIAQHTHARRARRRGERARRTTACSRCCRARRRRSTAPTRRYADVRNGIGIDGFDTWSAEPRPPLSSEPHARRTCRRRWSAPPISTQYGTWADVPGVRRRLVSHRRSRRIGRRIATATGLDVGGWGPTWVDYAPWGYAPFHYGRWAYIGGRWGWCPGSYVARPLWAPALVGWDGGSGWRLSVDGRRPGLRLGAARLGRAVPSLVGPLLERLLEPLQPAVRGERRRASATAAADALRQLQRAGRRHRGVRRGVRLAASRCSQSSSTCRAAGVAGAAARSSNAPQVKPLPITPNRVRPRQRRADSRVERLRHDEADGGVAAAPRSPSAPGAPGAAAGHDSRRAYNAAGSPPPATRRPHARAPAQNAAGSAATHRRRPRRRAAPSPGSKPQTAIAPSDSVMSRRRIRTAPCAGRTRAPPRGARRIAARVDVHRRADARRARSRRRSRRNRAMSAPPAHVRAGAAAPQPAMSARARARARRRRSRNPRCRPAPAQPRTAPPAQTRAATPQQPVSSRAAARRCGPRRRQAPSGAAASRAPQAQPSWAARRHPRQPRAPAPAQRARRQAAPCATLALSRTSRN